VNASVVWWVLLTIIALLVIYWLAKNIGIIS